MTNPRLWTKDDVTNLAEKLSGYRLAWSESLLWDDFEGLALTALHSLAAAGRLLPEPVETRTESGWAAEHRDGRVSYEVTDDAEHAAFVAEAVNVYVASLNEATAAAFGAAVRAWSACREVRTYPDGSTLNGPWVPVPDTKEDP